MDRGADSPFDPGSSLSQSVSVGYSAKESSSINQALGYTLKMDVSNAARLMGRRSAQSRIKRWGKKEFVRRLREWGKLGGRPRKSKTLAKEK